MPSPNRSLTLEEARCLIRGQILPATTQDRVGAEIEWFTTPPVNVQALRDHLSDVRLPFASQLTFEPGGQVELSSAPYRSIAAVCTALRSDTAVVAANLRAHGVELHASGIDPTRSLDLCTDEQRYVAMRSYFDRHNRAGAHMMCTSAAVHVNVDAGDDDEGRARWRVAHQIGPMLVAAFANSPVVSGRESGWMSSRMAAWLAIDATRAAPALNGADPAESWIDYALGANVMFVRTDRGYIPATESMTFARWIDDGHELGHPTNDDLLYHLTTLFPPVRMHGWLELRMIDMLPDPWWHAAVAVTVALVCNEDARARAQLATRGCAGRWVEAARRGLDDPLLREAARECFAAAEQVLESSAADDATRAIVSAYRDRFVQPGRSPAAYALQGIDISGWDATNRRPF